MRYILLLIFVGMVVAVFSIQNSQPVSVSVLAWSFETSLAIIMFLSVIFGLVIGFISAFAFHISRKRRLSGKQVPGQTGQ